MSMKGKDRFLRRLRRLSPAAEAAAKKVLYVGSDRIKSDVFQSISTGSASGKRHIPSRPGEPPNRDTGDLQRGLRVELRLEQLEADVISESPHSRPLEFGTSKMEPRPHMRPARDKNEHALQRLFAREFNSEVKRSGQ